MFTTRPAHRRAITLVVALAAVTSACGSTADDDAGEPADSPAATTSETVGGADDPADSVPTPTSASSDESESTDNSSADEEPDEPADESPTREDVEVLALPVGLADFPVLGGIEFELPEATRVLQTSGCVLIEQPGYAGGSPYSPYVVVAGVVASGRNTPVPISTIDEWIELYEGQPEPSPNGKTLSALGLELEGYNTEGAYADAPPPDDRFLNCSADAGSVASLVFLPSGHSEVFLAESDDALVVIGLDAFTADDLEGVRPMFEQVTATLQSTEE